MLSSSIILDKISKALDVYSQHLFDVGIKIRHIKDSYEDIIFDLDQKVDAGIISKQDSIEFKNIADLWLNLYKLFICHSVGATFTDRDIINNLIELYKVKQISKDFLVETVLALVGTAVEKVTKQCVGQEEQNFERKI